MAALAQMAADLSGINRLVPEIRLGDRAAEVVETATRERVGAAFRALELKLADAIERTGADVEARVTNADAGGRGNGRRGGWRVFTRSLRGAPRRDARRREGGARRYQVAARGEAGDGGVVAGGV